MAHPSFFRLQAPHAILFTIFFIFVTKGGAVLVPTSGLRSKIPLAVVDDDADGGAVSGPSVVKLEIYYEALCPYCHSLLLNSLRPIWKDPELRERIDLKLFPAGNVVAVSSAEVSDGYHFWHPELKRDGLGHVFMCQHGEQECMGNMVQACAMELLGGPAEYLPFVFCMTEGLSNSLVAEKASFECMRDLGINATEVAECTRTSAGNDRMFAMATASASVELGRDHVPWVVLNGEHAGEADEGDMLGPLCHALDAPLPSACTAVSAAPEESEGGAWGKVRGWLGVSQTSAKVTAREGGSDRYSLLYPQRSIAL